MEEIAGRRTPLMVFIISMDPTNTTPVLPAVIKASIFPLASNWKPMAIDDCCFTFHAFAGCSFISITSGPCATNKWGEDNPC